MEKITIDLTKDVVKKEKFLEALKSAIKHINSTGKKVYVKSKKSKKLISSVCHIGKQ